MPFLPDGTPLDIVLNPWAFLAHEPGRVLEVHLGMAARTGLACGYPVFDGASEALKSASLRQALTRTVNPVYLTGAPAWSLKTA